MCDINRLPSFLRDKLVLQYGEKLTAEIEQGSSCGRVRSLRVNTEKCEREDIVAELSAEEIAVCGVPWYRDAFVVTDAGALSSTAAFREGRIYLQSLSSMLPPLYLDPQPREEILDMTAAPGGKTAQLYALSHGSALITACERDRLRFDRLAFNLRRQGAMRVNLICSDALKLDDVLRFDKILLDAPCSGSGTLDLSSPLKISRALIENCAKLQRALLKKAVGLLKRGGLLVYSTCSVLSEENEGALESVLSRADCAPVPLEAFGGIPLLPSPAGTVCVKPTREYEGFFVAAIRKK